MWMRSLTACDDLGVGVAQDHGAPGADVVDVAVAVGVEDIGPGGAGEEDRVAADAAEGPHRGVHAPGDVALGGGEEVVGAGHGADPVWVDASVRSGKEPGVGRGRRLGVRVGKDAADHGQQVGPGGDQGGAILWSDAAYGNQRQAEARRARRSRSGSARTASGLVAEGKKLPKAT